MNEGKNIRAEEIAEKIKTAVDERGFATAVLNDNEVCLRLPNGQNFMVAVWEVHLKNDSD